MSCDFIYFVPTTSSQVFQPGEPFWLTPSRVKGTVLFLSIPWKAGKWSRMHSHVSVHMEMSGPHRAFAENRRLEMGDGFLFGEWHWMQSWV